MSEWEEKLNTLLSDPDAMAQVMNMAQNLSQQMGQSGGSAPPPPPAGGAAGPAPSAPPPPPPQGDPMGDLSSLLGGIDPTLIQRLLPLLSQMNRAESSETTAFLLALRPFLKPERRDKVERAAQLGYVNGVGGGKFEPNRQLTRAEFVTMLYRMADKHAANTAAGFTDVPQNAWYRDALNWAAEKGYVNGTGANTFSPDGKITRQEVVTILFRYSGSQSGAETMFTATYDSQFTDSGAIAPWAKTAMYWAIYNGVVNGTSPTTVSPTATATRAEVAAIFVRYAK